MYSILILLVCVRNLDRRFHFAHRRIEILAEHINCVGIFKQTSNTSSKTTGNSLHCTHSIYILVFIFCMHFIICNNNQRHVFARSFPSALFLVLFNLFFESYVNTRTCSAAISMINNVLLLLLLLLHC